jgi:NADH-quinone oxidoreductase subunit N
VNAIDLGNPGGMIAAMLPEGLLTLWAVGILLFAAFRHETPEDQRVAGRLALVGLSVALIATLIMWIGGARTEGLPAMVSVDAFRFASATLVLGGAILSVVLSLGYLTREEILVPEYYALLLFAVVGMMVMCAAADLIVVFLGLELMSLSVYALVGLNRRSSYSAEGALKYFLLGAFASGFLLYGIALIYGATGTTNLPTIESRVTGLALDSNVLMLAGIGMLLVGFGFKVAAVPFHMWAPDVYDGAPTPVTGFMAAAVKAAGFAAMIRVFVYALGDSLATWQQAVWWLSILTMLGGNLMALAQRRMKRMLAYSSIGHAGYLLAAVTSGTVTGASAFLFYGLAYTLVTIGAFSVVAIVGRGGERDLLIDDFAGLGAKRPWLAFATTVFMLSLLGFPGTAGFIGKWFILLSTVEAGEWTLAIALVVASLISAGFYLPVIMQMYMQPARSSETHAGATTAGSVRAVLAVAATLLVLLGIWPNLMLDVARNAGGEMRPSAEFTMVDDR